MERVLVSSRTVLLVEPWFGGSHRAWAEGVAAHSAHDVHLMTLEDRWWRWRTEGAALALADAVASHVEAHGPPDVLLASTMVDLAALLGLARRSLGDVPVVHFVHESQLLYPPADGRPFDRGAALAGWRSLVAADLVVFGSDHHRRALREALPPFLRSFPDHHDDERVGSVLAPAEVLPVGIDADRLARGRPPSDGGAPVVLWNHRWEHDKQPEAFVQAIAAVDDMGVPFRLALAGERPVHDPPWLAPLRARLGDRLVAEGGLPRAEYEARLRRTDVVVSTARHELFGVAVCEAAAAGAAPLLPDRLSYPEVLPSSVRYHDPADLVPALVRLLRDEEERAAVVARTQPEALRFDWAQVIPGYDEMLGRVAG